MRGKSMMLLLVAIGCGLVASIGISQVVTQSAGAASNAPETAEVFVASKDVNINDPLDTTNVNLAVWPKDKIPEGAVTDIKNLEGKYARSWIYQNEVILEKKLTDARGDNLVIPEGFRVMPLQVDAARMSKLIKPGDRVDVMLYIPSGEGFEAIVKTILADVRVFAVNARIERTTDDKEEELARFVDVLVNPEQSEVLTLAAEMGSISLSLRRPDDPTVTKTEGTQGADLLGLRQQRGTKVREGADEENSGPPEEKFRDWLDQMSAGSRPGDDAEPVVAAPVQTTWTMLDLTPDGPVEYEIGEAGKPPVRKEKAGDGGSSASDGDAKSASEPKAVSDRDLGEDPNLLEYLRERGEMPEGVEVEPDAPADRS